MTRTLQVAGKKIGLEDYAFYSGAQGIPPHDGLEEIEQRFAQEKAKLEHTSVPIQKPLEAILTTNAAHRPRIERVWKAVQETIGDHAPPIVLPACVAALGLVALLIDMVMTAPSLDVFGISEPVIQYIASFALAALSAVIFHLALESFESSRMDVKTRWGVRILAACAIVCLSGWGVLRAHEVAFGADIAGNQLGGFLHGHFFLACLVFCFVTLGAPLAAAFAVGYTVPRIHDHRRWKKAHKDHQQLVASTSKAESELHAERDKLSHSLKQLESERREWQARFMQYHERGTARGGREEPFWLVILKSLGVALAACRVALPFAASFWPLYLAPVAAGCIAFVHFRRLRFTPSYRKFRKQEATHFTVTDSARPELASPKKPKVIEARLEEPQ